MLDSKFEFQVYDWNSYHEVSGSDEEKEEQYVIQMFGRTLDDKDVCIKVVDFKPFFYIKIPKNWSLMQVDALLKRIKKKVQYMTTQSSRYNYDMSESLIGYKIVKRHIFENFDNGALHDFVALSFSSCSGMSAFATILAKQIDVPGSKHPILFQRFESNLEPHIRFMHIQDLPSCGWISINKKDLHQLTDYSTCDHVYSVNWRNVNASPIDNVIAPFKIMGYDIECISCDTNFPQATRSTDKIIQIGITMYRYGSMQCYEKHILILGDCADISNVNIECYKSESSLLLGFAKKIKQIRPDFKCGYNNCGFDDKYIVDRIMTIDNENNTDETLNGNTLFNKFFSICGKLNNNYLIDNENCSRINSMSIDEYEQQNKMNGSLSFFKVQNLSSSALGDNRLFFIQSPGTLTIDMMKVIQRDYNLTSYKLDDVASNFITERVEQVENIKKKNDDTLLVKISTKSTKALENDSYIQLMVNDSYSLTPLIAGVKYKVVKVDKNVDDCLDNIYINMSKIQFDELTTAKNDVLLTVIWTFAKDDMHHTLINKYFNEGDPEKIKIIAKYCIKDCKLVNLLLAKLEIIINCIGMATVCNVPLSYLFLRGQGVKIFSLVSKKCRQENYLIPVIVKDNIDVLGDDDNGYEGATVIKPKPGVYLSPIAVLDYNALYPNSMREKNLSHECYVDNDKYDNLPGYIYHNVVIVKKNKKGKVLKNFDGTPIKEYHKYAQKIVDSATIEKEFSTVFEKLDNENKNIIDQIKNTGDNIDELVEQQLKILAEKREQEILKKYNFAHGHYVKYGIIPEILTELLNKRADTNAQLKLEKDSFVKTILNGRQLAFKVTANSLYGQTGAPTSPIYKIAIAASTTAIGRERLYDAKKLVEKHFGGSSVQPNSHSSEVIYGDSVTGDTPIIYRTGFTIKISTIEKLNDQWTNYDVFKAGESNRCEKSQTLFDAEIWTANGWSKVQKVIRHKTIKQIYRVSTSCGSIDVTEDHSLLTPDNRIIKPSQCCVGTSLMHGFIGPFDSISNIDLTAAFILGQSKYVSDEILNCDKNVKQAFFEGYLSACLENLNNNNGTLFFVSKQDAQRMYCLLIALEYDTTICTTDNVFKLIYSKTCRRRRNNPLAIKSITSLGFTDETMYVYDIETSDGTFHAGIGSLIVKNTDSIFINFHIKDIDGNELTDKVALAKTIELAKQAAVIINKNVPRPQKIVYEKTMHPFILITKKKYVGFLYESDIYKYYLKSMGIVLKRRDNSPIVKILVGGIINCILINRDVDEAIQYTRNVLTKLMNSYYPIDKFILSKRLRADYANPMSIAHKVLADRMAIRDPGNKPQTNDRIQFVYFVNRNADPKTCLQGDLVENPDYVLKNNLQVDYLYYLEHQIIKPATQILELMISTRKISKIFDQFRIHEQNKRMGRQDMTKWMSLSKFDDIDKCTHKPLSDLSEIDKLYSGKIAKEDRYENADISQWVKRKQTNNVVKQTIKPKRKKKVEHKKVSMDTWMK